MERILSSDRFESAVTDINLSNAATDLVLALDERFHFDNEEFQGGRDVITAGIGAGSMGYRIVSE